MKKALLITTSVIAFTVIMLSIKNQPSHLKQTEKEDNDRGDARGMIDYFNKINGDPVTGRINLDYYYAALEQAKNAMAMSRTAGGVQINWEFVGPDNIGGRTRAILFDKNTPQKVFAGSVSGGLWISTNGGANWTEWSGSDSLANMCIVTLCQDDSGYIYFGTGEGLYDGGFLGIFGGGFPGDGVWRSKDDGATFQHLSATIPNPQYESTLAWSIVNRIAADPNADTLIAATQQGFMYGVKSGTVWTQVPGIIPVPADDVKYSIDGKKVFATEGGDCYYSSNSGKTFTRISGTKGFPSATNIGRIEIAVSPTNPNYAYAALVHVASNDEMDGALSYVVQTTNGGASWTAIGTGTGGDGAFDPTSNQGLYDLTVAVSPQDPGTLFLGGTTLWRWNTATGWEQVSAYNVYEFDNSLHADLHALVFDPGNSSRMLIGCDGGIAQTLDPFNGNNTTGVLYSSLNVGYNVTQFYSVSADSTGIAIGGTQDNGNQNITGLGNSASFPPYHDVSDQSSNIILGGDGGCTTIALSNDQAYFGQTPYGNVVRSSNAGTTYANFYDASIDSQISGVGGQFYTPFSLWEDQGTDSGSIHVTNGTPGHPGTHKPVKSLFAIGLNSGEVWVTPSGIDFGASPDWFRLQNVSGNVTATTFSLDGKYLYVGTDAGKIYRYSGFDSVFKKKNGWKYPSVNDTIVYHWNAADSGIAIIQSTYAGFNTTFNRTILSIGTDPNDTNHIVVTCGNYGGTKIPYVAISHNAEDTGSNINAFTFTSAQGSGATALPYAPVYSSCILHETYQGNPYILVGTPVGVWVSTNDGISWQPDNNGLANVVTMSIKELPYYGGYALYAGTHGRGIFRSFTFTTGINTIANNTESVNDLNVFPNPLSATGHIQYTVSEPGTIIINLYDIQGKLVKVISNKKMIAGPADIQFNVADLVSGTYIVDVVEGNKQATRKLVVLH